MDNEELNQGQMTEEKESVGCIGIGLSFLFPLPGVIMYFINRKAVKNPSAYLYAALAGFIIGIIFLTIQ